MKKFLSLILALALCLGLSVPATAVEEETANDALNKLTQDFVIAYHDNIEAQTVAAALISCYQDDPMFCAHYQADAEDAIGMVASVAETAIQNLSEPMPYAAYFEASGVPTYKQVQTNSCGVASALQVIVQQGGEGNIAGTTRNDKEKTMIKNDTGLAQNGSTIVYEVRNMINKYTSQHTYSYLPTSSQSGKITDYSTFRSLIISSLRQGCPIVLHAIPKHLSYYPSSAIDGHYIVGYRINCVDDKFYVNDCHYDANYNGPHMVTLEEAYNSISGGRYLIFAQ